MLYALSHPVALVGLVAGLLLAVVVHGSAQALVAARLGDRQPKAAGRLSLDPRRHLDPFGAVAAALAGPGWGRPVEMSTPRFRSSPWRPLVALAAGPLAAGALGLGLLAAARASGSSALALRLPLSELLHGRGALVDSSISLLLLSAGSAALALALLSLVPLPPLDAGRALFLLAPRRGGWERARHWLVDQNLGLVAVLVLLVFPIAGERPLLLVVLDQLAAPLLLLAGGS